ncbi:MAG: hypothetical protein COB53_06940 [Elusimicrobia bacterium]|nr:MAG: hypothetical protein COB53_06940 [Elusimicrobiota bacterium]
MKIPLLSAILAIFPAFASAAPSPIETHILDSINSIWAMNFDESEAHLDKATKLDPDYPYTYFGRANLSWLRFVYVSQQTDPKLKKKFEKQVEEAVAASQKWLKTHPKDAQAYLALSGSYGLRARLSTIQKHWIRALMDGRRAVKYTRKAHKLNPKLYDALLGAGVYDYYSDALPRGIKLLSRLILGGDRDRGIASLKIVAEKGNFTKIAAQLLLIEIYTEDQWGARDPQKAVDIISALRKEFPQSPIFHKIEHVCLYEAKRFKELKTSVDDYQKRIDADWAYYPKKDRARMFVTQGTAQFAQAKLPEAQTAFQEAGKLAGSSKKPDRWGVWGLVRLGQVRDALKSRKEAVEAYASAMKFPDIWGFRGVAKKGRRRPILLGLTVGQLPPP